MRISVIQHTPSEGPGAIALWSHAGGHALTCYHPYQFGRLPTAENTDLLVLLGGPMSPNDDTAWIKQERALIQAMLTADKPMFGACFGAQQITKTLGYPVTAAEAKEVGWAKIYRQTTIIPGLPATLTALHWHQEKFALPQSAHWLFSSDLVSNQGFVLDHKIVGLQCHLEPLADDVRTMVANDGSYIKGSALHQSPAEILAQLVPAENQAAIFAILDYITA
ncbi:type 1 glutamine amidotransferase [Lacticaseibacillus baoqingensis]|uniref:Type 1 glutamine amidotransferase n=1 Tax=Lacticaseibacillus baoqingensis TaxID=2486013 RepID=A0ABW4E7L4_9LACO|nr:type 1 glutamine amidotransferase [Lacticaseibacillus baoqingensis]